ncbi:MAG: hypothetical protein ACO35Q_09015 [Prochlorothrix sp.]
MDSRSGYPTTTSWVGWASGPSKVGWTLRSEDPRLISIATIDRGPRSPP